MKKIDLGFKPLSSLPVLKPGLAYRLVNDADESHYFRITHVFNDIGRLYYMEISTPEQVRHAKRPQPMLINALMELFSSGEDNKCGHIPLPQEFIKTVITDKSKLSDAEIANNNFKLIKPLLDKFKNEKNLQSRHFEPAIVEHSKIVELSPVSIRKLLLRYWYFGQTVLALAPLSRGPKTNLSDSKIIKLTADRESIQAKRHGRQPRISKILGENAFTVGPEDIQDIRSSLLKKLRKGYTTVSSAYLEYLSTYFFKRHPDTYKQYLAKKIPEPVTIRQFRYYTSGTEWLDPELAKNLIKSKRYETTTGALIANGPNEMYELDATVNRVFLVSKRTGQVIGQPTLYVVIDRWSRYITGVYVSLKSPSWDELRYAILISFTSRTKRFSQLGVDIDDDRWPIGKPPAVFCVDRGSEFRSYSMEESVAKNLRIEINLLPPRTPDGKAIVERVIRELKSRNGSAPIAGAYQLRPKDYETKKAVKKAKAVAAYNLQEIFQLLIREVESYNNSPHGALKKNHMLAREGVAPTPKAAYLWGQINLTGLSRPPYSDDDYQKMLLGVDNASIAGNTLNYKGLAYKPANNVAKSMLLRAGKRSKQVQIRVDKSAPSKVYIESSHQEWATWDMTPGALKSSRGMTLDEIDVFHEEGSMLWDEAKNDQQILDLQQDAKRNKPRNNINKQKDLIEASSADARQLGIKDTLEIKNALKGVKPKPSSQPHIPVKPSMEPWEVLAEAERNRRLIIIAKARKGK